MEEGANHGLCEPIQGRRKRDRGLNNVDITGIIVMQVTWFLHQVNGALPLMNATAHICKSIGKKLEVGNMKT